jgi:hypothetical protein
MNAPEHIANIFSKLELLPASDDHRRVLAVFSHLRGLGDRSSGPTDVPSRTSTER